MVLFLVSFAKSNVAHSFIYVQKIQNTKKFNKPVCINCIHIEVLRASIFSLLKVLLLVHVQLAATAKAPTDLSVRYLYI